MVARLLSAGYGAAGGKPGFILFVQTFGDLVTFHPHIHALVSDGVFTGNGVFRVLSPLPVAELEQAFRAAVIGYLIEEEAIDEAFGAKLLGWEHSGFSVDASVRVRASDAEGRQQLARYMVRNPFSLEKMEYKAEQGVVVYRSKFHATLKRNFQLLPGAEWLKLLLRHVPDKGEHLVRYYGWYSNRARGERARAEEGDGGGEPLSVEGEEAGVAPEFRQAAKAAWARLIKKVYEVDPLTCPHCGEPMRFLAVIEEGPVIERCGGVDAEAAATGAAGDGGGLARGRADTADVRAVAAYRVRAGWERLCAARREAAVSASTSGGSG